jgi:hypothetical protein
MKQGLGDHLGAVRELNRGITATDKEAQRIELRFLRGGWVGVGRGWGRGWGGGWGWGAADCLVCTDAQRFVQPAAPYTLLPRPCRSMPPSNSHVSISCFAAPGAGPLVAPLPCAGACHHAVGLHRQAVDDYQGTLEAQGALTPGSSHELVQVGRGMAGLLLPWNRRPLRWAGQRQGCTDPPSDGAAARIC